MNAIKAYPFTIVTIGYAIMFLLFVTALLCFHTVLIKDAKTTQEKLKQEPGEATGHFKSNPYSYSSTFKNISSTLCCRPRKSHSKLTWELYLYSLGLMEELLEYWSA
jgi:hypothetical protein